MDKIDISSIFAAVETRLFMPRGNAISFGVKKFFA
jgi:hypothetical protein